MQEENRNLVRLAFRTIRSLWYRSEYGDHFPIDMLDGFSDVTIRAFEGLYYLVEVIASNGGRPHNADETFFGFSIGPILNSARRVDLASKAAFDVFIGNTDAFEAAEHLYDLNQARKDIVGPLSECAVVNSSLELTTGLIGAVSSVSCAFCYGADGCLGLISSALCSYTGYPAVCFVLSRENYRGNYERFKYAFVENNNNVLSGITTEYISGSARAPGWFDFYAFVEHFNKTHPGSIRFGGHGQAGSFTVLTRYISEFSRELFHFALEIFKSVPPEEVIPPYDLSVFMGDQSEMMDDSIFLDSDHFDEWIDFSRNLDTLKPFGEGFPKPTFRVAVDVSSKDIAVQYLSGGKHLKCSFKDYDLILWNCGETFSIDRPLRFYADTTLGVNEFRNKRTVTFYGNSYSKIAQEVENAFDIHVTEMQFGIL